MNIKIITLALIVFVFTISQSSALERGDIIGNSSDCLEDIAPQIKWITGTFEGLFLVAAVIGIFAGAIYYLIGVYGKNADAKGSGIKGILGTVLIVLLTTAALTLIFTIYNKFQ